MTQVSLKVIADKILRDSLFNGLQFEAIIDYCVTFFGLVEVSELYFDAYAELDVVDYRAELPTDLVSINQVMVNNIPIRYATDTFHQFYKETAAVNNFDNDAGVKKSADYTFKVQGDYIYTSVETGALKISYRAIPLDEDGVPMIPDNPALYRALKTYIELEYLRILWRNGKIADKIYTDAQIQYAWAVGAYETDARKLDLSKMEAITNMNTLLPRRSEFINRFRNLGTVENWKTR